MLCLTDAEIAKRATAGKTSTKRTLFIYNILPIFLVASVCNVSRMAITPAMTLRSIPLATVAVVIVVTKRLGNHLGIRKKKKKHVITKERASEADMELLL